MRSSGQQAIGFTQTKFHTIQTKRSALFVHLNFLHFAHSIVHSATLSSPKSHELQAIPNKVFQVTFCQRVAHLTH